MVTLARRIYCFSARDCLNHPPRGTGWYFIEQQRWDGEAPLRWRGPYHTDDFARHAMDQWDHNPRANALAAVRGVSIDAMRNLSRVESDPIRGHDQLCLTVHRLASALATILDTATTAGKE